MQGVADTASAAITGHGLSFLVGRVSYTFGLQVHNLPSCNSVWGDNNGVQ